MYISASSGLHCPLLTNSLCGTRNAAGNRCPGGGNILSSPQTRGSPQAEPAGGTALGRAPLPASSVPFSAVARRALWKGSSRHWRSLCCPSSCPLQGWFCSPLAEHVNGSGRG